MSDPHSDLNSYLKINPKALQSSMDYDEYLKAKLGGAGGPKGRTGAGNTGAVPGSRSSSSLGRDTAATSSRRRTINRKSEEMTKKEVEDMRPDFVPIQHSWRRHVESSSPSSSLNFATASSSTPPRAPTSNNSGASPAQIESLMKVAQDSMEESRRRSEMIDRLLASGGDMGDLDLDMSDLGIAISPSSSLSPSRNRNPSKKSLGPPLKIEINSPSRNSSRNGGSRRGANSLSSLDSRDSFEDNDSVSFRSGRTKARVFALGRAFKKLTAVADSSRRQREAAAHRLTSQRHTSVQRKFLQTWKAHSRDAAAQRAVRARTLHSSFRQLAAHRDRCAQDRSVAETFFAEQSRRRSFSALRALVDLKRERLYRQQIEALHSDHAGNFRDRNLLSAAFQGIKLASKLALGEKEIEQESAQRRGRIAAFMGALSQKGRHEDSAKTASERRREATASGPVGLAPSIQRVARERMGKERVTQTSAYAQRERGGKTTAVASARAGAETGRAAAAAGERRQKTAAAAAAAASTSSSSLPTRTRISTQQEKEQRRHGYDAEGKFDDGYAEFASKSAAAEIGGDVSKEPPPYSKQSNPPRSKAAAAAAAASAVAERKSKTGADQQQPSQGELDSRARARRDRIAALRRASQQRVHQTQREKDLAEARRKELDDLEFEREQEEHAAKSAHLKVSQKERQAREADLKLKAATAVEHRTKSLLIQRGLGPWRRLVQDRRIAWVKAMDFREDTLLQQSWIALYGYCMALRTEKARRDYRQTATSVSHYKRSLMREHFRRWSLHRRLLKAKANAVTGHFSRFAVHRRAFGAWRISLERERRRMVQALRSVKPRGDRSIKRHFWRKWLEMHTEFLLEREVASRAESQWARVQSWLN